MKCTRITGAGSPGFLTKVDHVDRLIEEFKDIYADRRVGGHAGYRGGHPGSGQSGDVPLTEKAV
jgi:hypothetical protein